MLVTALIPFTGFLVSYFLNYKKLYGLGFLIITIVSIFHSSIVVYSYEYQFLEIIFVITAIIPIFPIDNLKLIKVIYILSYLCFLFFGFHFKHYNLLDIPKWPLSILIYFVLMNIIFLVLYQFLIPFKKNSLNYRLANIKKNEEIEKQNNLIQLNTKRIMKFEHEKHELELTDKRKDKELLNINNQLKIKIKSDLIDELQKIKKGKIDYSIGIQKIITKLRNQIEEEEKIDLLQDNLELVGSDFNERVLHQFPDLSKAEIELLSFIKLNLSNKQIAIQKNTSPNTINVALHRLRQKCRFETTNDLKKFIEEF